MTWLSAAHLMVWSLHLDAWISIDRLSALAPSRYKSVDGEDWVRTIPVVYGGAESADRRQSVNMTLRFPF